MTLWQMESIPEPVISGFDTFSKNIENGGRIRGARNQGRDLHPEGGDETAPPWMHQPELLHGAKVSSLGRPLSEVFHPGATAPQTQMAPSEAQMGFTTI